MNAFRSALARHLLRWRFGLLIAGILRAAFWLGLAFLLLGAFDYYAGFSDRARQIVFGIIVAVGVATALWGIVDSMAFMRRDAAQAADRASASIRQPVLSALELERAQPGSPLETWLRGRAVDSAAETLGRFSIADALPVSRLRRNAALLLAVAAFIGLAFAVAPRASRIIATRLLDPKADIPPYSPLEIAIGPRPAEVLYGGELVIVADITGGRPDSPVRCLTRDPATKIVEESPAYQESESRYSRKLERVAAPLEVAFSAGRARSAWLPVQVRMQPKLQEVLVTVEPPAYSRRPRREFMLGSQELSALPGSRITVSVTSNRPLSGGALALEVLGANKGHDEVPGERADTHRVKFSWLSKGGTLGTLRVRDVIGTASEPLQFEQKLLPDERPEVVLSQPAGEVLATPDTQLPLEGRASDDLGLSRVALVRKLVGYRERSQSEVVQTASSRHQIEGKINLAAFGVVPGQTIELAIEAGDTNPNLLGVSISEPARIRIITREQYAELLRAQTTLEEFSERFAALQEAIEEARKALEELEQAAKSGDPKRAEEARQRAFDAHKSAAEIFGKIATDFQIFDLDGPLADVSAEVAKQLGENGRSLDALKGATPQDMAAAIAELKERLGQAAQQAQEEIQKGKDAAAAGKVIEQAGRFSELLQQQRELTKDFNRAEEQIRRGETQASQALKELAKRQSEIRDQLQNMQQELGSALRDLPDGFEKFQQEGEHFLELLGALEIPPTMGEAAQAAEQANSTAAGNKAREALEKMEAMLRQKNGFCEMCRGGDTPFPWPEDLSQTMQQLMQSLLRRGRGSGDGQKPGGGGTGTGGASDSSDSGFSMQGKLPRLPVHGPPRTRFSRKAGPSMGGGKSGTGAGKEGPGSGADVAGGQIANDAAARVAGEAATAEAVPEAYRAAVKRFFSTGSDSTPATPNP